MPSAANGASRAPKPCAEALRQALRLWLEQQQPQHRQVFGLWRDRSDDALTIQDSLRQEWAGR